LPLEFKKDDTMETYDIYFKEGTDFANKGFSLKDKAKAIRMAEDMLAERKGYVKDFVGGTISVMCKETKEEVWSKLIEEV
jgi:hypothetical protein